MSQPQDEAKILGRRDLLRAIGGGAVLLSAGSLMGCSGNILGRGDNNGNGNGGSPPPSGRSIEIPTNPVPVVQENGQQVFLLSTLRNFDGNSYSVFGTEVPPGLPGRITQIAAWQGSPGPNTVRIVFDAAGKPVEIYIPGTGHAVTLQWNATNTAAVVLIKTFDGTQLGGFNVTAQGNSFVISPLNAAAIASARAAEAVVLRGSGTRRLPDPFEYGPLVFGALLAAVNPYSPLLLFLLSALASVQVVALLAQSPTVARLIADHLILALTFFLVLSQAQALVSNRTLRPIQATLLPGLVYLLFVFIAARGLWLTAQDT